MDEHLKQALDIVKAQASIRNMTEEEITSMVQKLAASLKAISEGGAQAQGEDSEDEGSGPTMDPKKAIREKRIICLESGKAFKVLTSKHLAKFGLTPEQYREKWGYPKNTPLVCKALQRERRKKMQDMRLWEKRTKGAAQGKAAAAEAVQ